MKAATAGQMRLLDKMAIESYGIPGIVLMENAAMAVTNRALEYLKLTAKNDVIVVCGGGNNGGDGLAAARHLYQQGIDTSVFLLAEASKLKGDAAVNFNIAKNIGIPIKEVHSDEDIKEFICHLKCADLVIDAIFGTGIKGAIEGVAAHVINAINVYNGYVIAVDIPSGINGDTGEVCGCAVEADETVTFALPKIGEIIYPGKKYAGMLTVADIGIPAVAVDNADICFYYVDRNDINLPLRDPDSHKGNYGHVVIIGGSNGFSGAPIMASKAAIRSGAGLVTAVVPSEIYNVVASSSQEVMVRPAPDDGEGRFAADALDIIMDFIKKADAIAIGPGMQVSDDIIYILGTILNNVNIPVVLDADALNAIAKQPDLLFAKKAPLVLTPHPGEMSRLTGLTVNEVQKNRIKTAADFAKEHDVVLILKGAATVTACPDNHVYINSTGNAGMATGGSGDVLTGIIASLIAQGMKIEEAAYTAVFSHGLAGDMAAKSRGMHGMIAGDIIDNIPMCFKEFLSH